MIDIARCLWAAKKALQAVPRDHLLGCVWNPQELPERCNCHVGQIDRALADFPDPDAVGGLQTRLDNIEAERDEWQGIDREKLKRIAELEAERSQKLRDMVIACGRGPDAEPSLGPLQAAAELTTRIAALEAIVAVAREIFITSPDLKVYREDGGENHLGIALANLRTALSS